MASQLTSFDIGVKLLSPNAKIPHRSTRGAAGFDLFSSEECKIQPGEYAEVKLGIALDIPKGSYGKVSSRSGLAFRHKIFAFHGTIDNDFRGEIRVLLRNCGEQEYKICIGDRIAQMILLPYQAEAEMVETDTLTESVRDTNGFGSTGR